MRHHLNFALECQAHNIKPTINGLKLNNIKPTINGLKLNNNEHSLSAYSNRLCCHTLENCVRYCIASCHAQEPTDSCTQHANYYWCGMALTASHSLDLMKTTTLIFLLADSVDLD